MLDLALIKDELPEEVEAAVNGIRTIVTSEGIVFTGSMGEVLSEPVEELRSALSYINRLREDIRQRELREYRWQCSSCGHFQKHAGSKYRCDSCKRTNWLSGSFKREDLELWFDAGQAKDGDSL